MLKATISTTVTRGSVRLGGYFEKAQIHMEDELAEETVVTCDTLIELISMLSDAIDEFHVKTREILIWGAHGEKFTIDEMQGDSFYKEPFAKNFICIYGVIDNATNVAVRADLWKPKP